MEYAVRRRFARRRRSRCGRRRRREPAKGSALGFTGIAPTPSTVDAVKVPEGFDWAPIISWGDPLFKNTPAFDYDNQTVAAQREQAGYNDDYTQFMHGGPGNQGAHKGLLAFNNEYTNDELMFRGAPTVGPAHRRPAARSSWPRTASPSPRSPAATRTRRGAGSRAASATGASTPTPRSPSTVPWPVRRTCAPRTTRPASTSSARSTTAPVARRPWGTYLSGEENFNQYFNATGATGPVADPKNRLGRYGITSGGRGWERVQDRFSVLAEPNEVNRFGWIVEVDPEDPTSTPVKHTALGRLKHEGATVTLTADGRIAAYMGDDERYEYIYKFLSKNTYKEGDKKHNLTLLSEGDLYVAKLNGDGAADGEYDGTGHWIPLIVDGLSARHRLVGRGDPHLDPSGRERGRPHQDGPPRGRAAQPGQRPHLRRDDQQHGPHAHRDRRGQPARQEQARAHHRVHRGVAATTAP